MGGSPVLKRLLPLVGIAVILLLWRLRRAPPVRVLTPPGP